jgi:hypothetical protein
VAVTTAPAVLETPPRAGLVWGLWAFIWLLPFHVLGVAALFGAFGLPMDVVRAVAAWKEATVAVLLGVALWRLCTGRAARGPALPTDLAVAALLLLAVVYLAGAAVWFDAGLPAGLQLLGWRDAVYFTLLYFVGRETPHVAAQDRYLRALFAVGVVTCLLAILERLFVSPRMLTLLGAARYFQEFLNLAPTTQLNEYGLPDNYWTSVGDHVVRRAGSTYLSSQGFAVPFLMILPAATLWLFSPERRRPVVAWVGYAMLWTGLLLSVTRMTIVVCILQVAILTAARRRWGLAVGTGLVALTAFGVTLFLVPGLAAFLWDTLTWRTGSSVAHLSDWSQGIQSLLDHPLGVGLGAGGLTAVRFGLLPTAADSQYFKYSVEMGAPGLLLFVGMLVAIGVAGLRAARQAATQTERDYGALVVVAVLGLALNGITTTPLTNNFFTYVLFWLAGAVATVAGRR